MRRSVACVVLCAIAVTIARAAAFETDVVVARFPLDAIQYPGAVAWSPDDATLIYAAGERGVESSFRLYTVPSTGGSPARLLDDGHSYLCPAFSPDGRRIAFTSNRSGTWRIWTAAADGSDLRAVTPQGLTPDYMPAWSPDGRTIAYSTLTPSGPVFLLVPAGGGMPRRLGPGWRPRWSPDGRLLAFVEPRQVGLDSWDGLAVMPSEGGAPRRFEDTFEPRRGWLHTTDWSPDGASLVIAQRTGAGTALVAIDAASGSRRTLATVNGLARDITWSHKGDRVAYTFVNSARPGELHVLRLAGGAPVVVTPQGRGLRARLIEYPSADGVRVPSWLYEPPGSGHPALVWVHGCAPGTPCAIVDDDYDRGIQYFVGQGYVVLAPNYRGSVGYGDTIAAVRDISEPIADLVAAGRYLKALPSVDPSRVGIIGFSGGGFWTALVAGTTQGTFGAAVDFYGVSDLVEWGKTPAGRASLSRLLGPLPEHEAAYRAASPIAHASRFSAPILLVHGRSDRLNPFEHSVRLEAALRAAGRPVEFLQLEGGHGFEGSENARAFETSAGFLAKYLK